MSVAEFKNLLCKILSNQIDQFGVLDQLRRLKCGVDPADSFSRQKYVLQKRLLEQILIIDQSENYVQLLDETNRILQIRKTSKYSCCLIGCLFTSDDHRSYLYHLKRVHGRTDKLTCNFAHTCKRLFTSFDMLFSHVRDDHTRRNRRQSSWRSLNYGNTDCKCDILSCGGKIFPSSNDLMNHVINDHSQEDRHCIFESCNARFTPGVTSTARKHYLNKHKKLTRLKLKLKHLLHPPSDSSSVTLDTALSFNEWDDIEDGYEEDDLNLDILPVNDAHELEDEKSFLMMEFADFYNKMNNFKFVPLATVQDISEEYLANSIRSHKTRESKLRKSLQPFSSSLSELDIENIVRQATIEDDFIQVQMELNTIYKRDKFIKENFKYVEPEEIVLNRDRLKGEKKDSVHYIPVISSLKSQVEDRSFIDVIEENRNNVRPNNHITRDVTDGVAYKRSKYFRQNPEAFVANFYSDAVELTNPLGAAKGKHKIVQVFYSICQVPKYLRSKTDRMQLCMVFREKLLKKYGHSVIFQRLVEDLQVLETGIMVSVPVERKVKLGVLIYSADNLEAHSLGGFSCCFSSKDVCRWCHITYEDLQSNIHEFTSESSIDYWSTEQYDELLPIVREEREAEVHDFELDLFSDDSSETENRTGSVQYEEDNRPKKFGLRERCPLNNLKAFHAVISFAPDAMHDLMEGVIAQDLYGVIKVLVNKGWFNVDQYNKRLRHFGYTQSEASDKPQDVPLNLKGSKLAGKAITQWVHVRNFALIVQPFVKDADDEVFRFSLMLADITSRITATEFREYEIQILEDIIIKYLDQRMQLMENHETELGSFKPKHHFLVHYPQAIRLFGPPLTFWTARYEAKHRIAKNGSEACKNFKNISLTLSVMQQMRMASTYYHGMFDTSKVKLPDVIQNIKDYESSELGSLLHSRDLVCKEVEYKSQMYRKGDLVIIKVLNDSSEDLEVGILQFIVVRDSEVYLVVRKYSTFKSYYGFYESDTDLGETAMVNIECLADYRPLVMRGTVLKFQFVLHHHVSTGT